LLRGEGFFARKTMVTEVQRATSFTSSWSAFANHDVVEVDALRPLARRLGAFVVKKRSGDYSPWSPAKSALISGAPGMPVTLKPASM
jgi:hypothetical protein